MLVAVSAVHRLSQLLQSFHHLLMLPSASIFDDPWEPTPLPILLLLLIQTAHFFMQNGSILNFPPEDEKFDWSQNFGALETARENFFPLQVFLFCSRTLHLYFAEELQTSTPRPVL